MLGRNPGHRIDDNGCVQTALDARNKIEIPNKPLKTRFRMKRDTHDVIIKLKTHVKRT